MTAIICRCGGMLQCAISIPQRTNPWSHEVVGRIPRPTLRSKRRRTMRTILILASAAFASAAAFTGPAAAEDLLHVTPPLFRDQARAAQQVRSTGDLTTTPHPVAT